MVDEYYEDILGINELSCFVSCIMFHLCRQDILKDLFILTSKIDWNHLQMFVFIQETRKLQTLVQ